MIVVVGHKNPDTDSICSAIALAEFLSKLGYNAVPARAGEVNKETRFVLERFKSAIPPNIKELEIDNVFLVDHNEASQLWGGIAEEHIVGIIDHHKLGGLSTSQPIYVRIEPSGSTCTMIAKLFDE